MVPKTVLPVILVAQVRYDSQRRLEQVYQRLWPQVIGEVQTLSLQKEQVHETNSVVCAGLDQTARTRSHD